MRKLRPWSAQLSHTVDWFDDDRATWKETAVTLGRITPIGTVLARASYSERFGLSDTQFEIEAYPRLRPGTYGYVNLGASFDKALYPASRVGLELYQSLGGGFEGSLGWRRLDFASATNIYVGTLTKYAGNWMLTGQGLLRPGGAVRLDLVSRRRAPLLRRPTAPASSASATAMASRARRSATSPI